MRESYSCTICGCHPFHRCGTGIRPEITGAVRSRTSWARPACVSSAATTITTSVPNIWPIRPATNDQVNHSISRPSGNSRTIAGWPKRTISSSAAFIHCPKLRTSTSSTSIRVSSSRPHSPSSMPPTGLSISCCNSRPSASFLFFFPHVTPSPTVHSRKSDDFRWKISGNSRVSPFHDAHLAISSPCLSYYKKRNDKKEKKMMR